MPAIKTRSIAAAIALGLVAVPAMADETWKSELGAIEWEKDVGGAAVFKIDLGKGKLVRFYIENLTASSVRGAFSGYWISTAEQQMCAATLTGPDGTTSRTWGRIDLVFMSKDFPSDWAAKTGECMGEPTKALTAVAPK